MKLFVDSCDTCNAMSPLCCLRKSQNKPGVTLFSGVVRLCRTRTVSAHWLFYLGICVIIFA